MIDFMRRIIFKIDLTLDGFIAGPTGEMDWAMPTEFGEEESWADVFDMLSTVDTVLMSRVIYQGFKEYWPAAATSPTTTKFEKEFSHWLENKPKIVFSKTLDQVDWTNARLVKGDLEKEIALLKQAPGKNFIIWGGSIFPQALMKLGLIDEYWIDVHPLILGKGKPLFTDDKNKIPFKVLTTKNFKTGVVGLRYEPVR
jgi:dihydrofolate reductase